MVRAKKSLGQHFLKDKNIALKIVQSLTVRSPTPVLEVGPGTGVLTQYLLTLPLEPFYVVEIDRESVAYLRKNFAALEGKVIEADVLKYDIGGLFNDRFAIIGNFPYNISSQIFFKVLENRHRVTEVVGMIQKEVAERIAAPPGNKTYGILSVLLQAYYRVTLLFKVPPSVFTPPPKVMSAVVRLERNEVEKLDCDEKLFFQVVKQGFNNRRKTLRNALKNLNLATEFSALPIFDQRAERLTVDEFVYITQLMEQSRARAGSI
jgi:16S rRNA (adenine1518-N6/adenine1519-N6)-dimethyltransferase